MGSRRPNCLIFCRPGHGSALAVPPGAEQDERHERDPEGRAAMLLTMLITVLFIGVSSAVLWLSIGAD